MPLRTLLSPFSSRAPSALLLAGLACGVPALVEGRDGVLPSPGDTLLAGTFADSATEALVRRAMEARRDEYVGLASYEARMRERVYLGLRTTRIGRERALFEQERAARVRWEEGGTGAVQWLAARRGGLADAALDEEGEERSVSVSTGEPGELIDADATPLLGLDPRAERLGISDGNWALHPLADTALQAYTYAPGDTLRILLPDGRGVTLAEVRVSPREAHFNRVAGSFWFARESGALVRASWRPSLPWSLEVEEPEDAEEIPAPLRPVEAEVDHVTVEYGLHDFRWWLPRRFALEAEARVGGFLRAPLTVEWTLDRYAVNEEESGIPVEGPLPPGWTRSERLLAREGESAIYVTIVVPPADSLLRSDALEGGSPDSRPAAFTEEELEELAADLRDLLPDDALRPRPRLSFGLEDRLLRFNRVEGLSGGVARSWAGPGRWTVRAEARLGVADLEPNAELALVRGDEVRGVRLAAYRRLDHASDWEDPFSIPSSVANLLLGNDRGHYFRTAGAEAVVFLDRRREQLRLRFFAERQDGARRQTTFHLLKPLGDDPVADVIAAREGAVGGMEATLGWFRGVDPGSLVLSGWVTAEAGGGDWYYNRVAGSVGASHPLPGGLAGAVEAGAGGAWGEVPVQRQFFLGGPETLRGFRSGDLRGPAFWFARAEVASDFPALRLVLFGDAAWAGMPETFGTDGLAASVGVGVSALDGFLRADLARAVEGGDDWLLHLYLDALF